MHVLASAVRASGFHRAAAAGRRGAWLFGSTILESSRQLANQRLAAGAYSRGLAGSLSHGKAASISSFPSSRNVDSGARVYVQ